MSSVSPSTDVAGGAAEISVDEQARRLGYFDLARSDVELLRGFAPTASGHVDRMIEDFYAHLLRFPELAAVLNAEPERLAKLKRAQRAHFVSMTEGRFDTEYFEGRLRVGDAHQRAGVPPDWYMGAFSLYLRLALRTLFSRAGDAASLLPTAEALIKAIFLDMSLAMSTYIDGGYVERDVATELEHAARTAEDALRMHAEVERLKDEMHRMVVHDLKNPVSGIAMLAQLALRKGQGLPDTHRGYFERIDQTCSEMMRLIENLLDIARIEEGKMAVRAELVSLAALAEDIVAEHRSLAADAGRTIRTTVPRDLPWALADPLLLRRVLTNLVVNSLRHSGSGDVLIDGGSEGDRVTLGVTDFGRGIAAEQQDRIFEKAPGGRRSAVDDPAGDTGLGLPFCRLAVEHMGGELVLQTRPGKTVFAVVLPAGRPSV